MGKQTHEISSLKLSNKPSYQPPLRRWLDWSRFRCGATSYRRACRNWCGTPSEVPLYCRVSSGLLVHSDTIEVVGPETSGEVEPLIIQSAGDLWLGLASDHTDRGLEAHSVAASKQICAKPAAKEVWRLSDVVADLDSLILRCSIKEGGSPARIAKANYTSRSVFVTQFFEIGDFFPD